MLICQFCLGCVSVFSFLVADQAQLQNTELKAHLFLHFQPIQAYFSKAFHCKHLCQASNVSSQYRHVLFIVSLRWPFLGGKAQGWRWSLGRAQGNALSCVVFLNFFHVFVHCRPSRSKRIPRPQPRPWRLGKLFRQFFCVFIFCSFIVILFAWQDLEEPQSADPTAASSTLQATWCPNTRKCLEHFHYFSI